MVLFFTLLAVLAGSLQASPPAFAQMEPHLSEQQAKDLAAAQFNVAQVLDKHHDLERNAGFDSEQQRWNVTWINPYNSRTIMTVVVDDRTGAIVSSDIKGEAWFDLLPSTTEKDAIDLARSQPRIQEELLGRDDVTDSATLGTDQVWTVNLYDGSSEIAQVLVSDAAGNVQEVRVGPQVAWQMARGYKGAFGRIINEPYIWLPLCLLFLAPFIDIREPLKILHLDLLVLLSFTISHYFFNLGEIFTSVPLAYPPLVYLFLRLAWIGWRRQKKRTRDIDAQPIYEAAAGGGGIAAEGRNETGGADATPAGGGETVGEIASAAGRGNETMGGIDMAAGRGSEDVSGVDLAASHGREAMGGVDTAAGHGREDTAVIDETLGEIVEPHLNFSPKLLIIGIAVLLVFRIVINIADSNVVDVGYSGVIGAHRILEGVAPYGNMPSDNGNGDTYGPLNYLVYVPFERVLPWSGTWDDLPAAHATAIFFDLLAVGGMYAAGRTLARGKPFANRLGLAFAWGWAAYPYTTFVLNCNVNDSIVAALIIWGFVCIQKAPLAGALLGFATQTKFFPAMLGPLWASFPRSMRGWGKRALFVAGFLLAVASTLPVIFLGEGSLTVFWEKTIKWQINRDSPFSIWGQYPGRLAGAQRIGQYLLVAASVGTYFWPLKKNMVQVAAISAALIVGFQIVQTHWFYLYIPWFFPLALIAFLTAASRSHRRGLEITRSYIAQPF